MLTNITIRIEWNEQSFKVCVQYFFCENIYRKISAGKNKRITPTKTKNDSESEKDNLARKTLTASNYELY